MLQKNLGGHRSYGRVGVNFDLRRPRDGRTTGRTDNPTDDRTSKLKTLVYASLPLGPPKMLPNSEKLTPLTRPNYQYDQDNQDAQDDQDDQIKSGTYKSK